MFLYFVIGVFALVIIGFAWWFPKRQTNKYNFEPGKRWQVENELRKTLIQVLGGLVVIGGLFMTFEQLKDSRKEFEQSRDEFKQAQENVKAGQLSSRFSKAIELLSKAEITTKVGGIYALEQIAREAPENYLGTVIEVLSAFVRSAEKEKYFKIKSDVQIAMTVLGRIRTEENTKYWENLPPIDLSNAMLKRATLPGANFIKTILIETDLRGANLEYTDFRYADFTKANLTKADLWKAHLMLADLSGIILVEADLTDAGLMLAAFTKANLAGANLTGANLWGAQNLTTDQLLTAKALYNVKGLPREREKELREKKPELFEKLEKWKNKSR